MSRFVFATTSNGSTSLYATDGAAAPVDLGLSRFGYISGTPGPIAFTDFGNVALFTGISGSGFSAYDSVYSTDGTAGGTAANVVGGSGGALAESGLWSLGNVVLTSGATIQTHTPGLWASSNGTSFNEIETGIGTSDIVTSGAVGYFAGFKQAQASDVSAGLWRTDGTQAGTEAITPDQALDVVGIVPLADGKAVFFNQVASGAVSLWSTGGTSDSTAPISDARLGSNLGTPAPGVGAGGRAFFVADAANGVAALWATDGTAAGTTELLGGVAGPPSRTPFIYGAWGNKALVTSGYALYATDGTPGGTIQLGGGNPNDAVGVGSQVFLTADDVSGDNRLWVSDGTFAGTTQVQVSGLAAINGNLAVVGNDVVFEGTDTSGKQALFEADGTASGSHELALGTAAVNAATVIGALPDQDGVVTLAGGNQSYAASPGTTVLAGSGSDTVTALSGQVTVTGGSGTLSFIGGTGASSVAGGAGSATIFGGSGGGVFSGGAGGRNVLVSQGAAGANTTLSGAAAGDQLFGSAQGGDLLIAGSGRESILGGGGDTTIDGGSAASVIFAGSGSATVNGGAGGDTIVGGAGALTVTAQHGEAVFGGPGSLGGSLAINGSIQGADSIIGGAGALNIAGRGANMLVVEGAGAANIATGNGASLVFEGSGPSTLTGGAGSMQLVLGSGSAAIFEATGGATYDAVRGAAGGTDVLHGFKPGADHIDLFGFSPSQIQIASAGGSSMISLADGTHIQIVGVTNLGNSVII